MSRFDHEWAKRLDDPSDEEFPDEMPALQTIGQAAIRLLPGLELSAAVSKFTESPIETMLAVAILTAWHNIDLRAPGDGWAPEWTLIPQFPWGRCRIDLAIRKPNGKLLFIECDGHEFHSTPEQIARDEARQREMTDAGIPVVRFTGSEINYSPAACVSQLYRFRGWGR